MSVQQVTVIARLKVKQGLEDRFREEFEHVIALTRTEDGCINYDLHQSIEDHSVFLLHENWASQAILDLHLQQPYIRALGAKSEEFLVEPPEIKLLQQIVNH
ncbi:antibiotic biosynthesis monooxygenase [Nostoc sp. LEGE 06077]|uniref:putative quinol monooxygenase n=1 Tax=Nostoc sp. LEGE 06077 TaxID=915325 RepID=UPI001882AD4D|nr:putative quinol monooxygenase [Nostoc sp. LEGE 06077]MBE9209829.1 antibiotic biosynthesis monooxygenase [Nostoc sp. LEGE 06077]